MTVYYSSLKKKTNKRPLQNKHPPKQNKQKTTTPPPNIRILNLFNLTGFQNLNGTTEYCNKDFPHIKKRKKKDINPKEVHSIGKRRP